MIPKVWQYESPEKQTSHFRGYVLEYTDSPTVYRHACEDVRKNKWKAKEDAEKLVKKLKLCQKSQTMNLSVAPLS